MMWRGETTEMSGRDVTETGQSTEKMLEWVSRELHRVGDQLKGRTAMCLWDTPIWGEELMACASSSLRVKRKPTEQMFQSDMGNPKSRQILGALDCLIWLFFPPQGGNFISSNAYSYSVGTVLVWMCLPQSHRCNLSPQSDGMRRQDLWGWSGHEWDRSLSKSDSWELAFPCRQDVCNPEEGPHKTMPAPWSWTTWPLKLWETTFCYLEASRSIVLFYTSTKW